MRAAFLELMRRWAWLAWLAQIGVLCYWLFDRASPFEVLDYVEPIPAAAGDSVHFELKVRRDLDRGCDVLYSRHLIDASGVRYDYAGKQIMSEQALLAMEKRTPGKIKVDLPTPPNAAPGAAVYTTTLLYRCNPLHSLWPISVTTEWPFTILPKRKDAQ